MNANKSASHRYLKSDLAVVDAHVLKTSEYEELPELTEEMLARACQQRGSAGVPESSQAAFSEAAC